jgi:hypothetical protein
VALILHDRIGIKAAQHYHLSGMRILFTGAFFILFKVLGSQTPLLKYIVYDFDGLNTGEVNLPDGDFKNTDLNYWVETSPLAASEVIGDRVLKLNLTWSAGIGEFGKTLNRFLELDPGADQFHFYFYNPASNSGPANVSIEMNEDDNGNNILESNSDDKWVATRSIPASGGWQLISIPLSSFTDGNSGGNGAFDARYTGAGGMLFNVVFTFSKPVQSATSDVYYLDMICFTEGGMPQGNSPLELPPKLSNNVCMLGALTANASPDQVPAEIHSLLPATKKISFVNWFVYYSSSGTIANKYTGAEVQSLLDQGITPVITWESMYNGYSRLDPVQPRLDAIINGSFDGYIDAFAAKIKSYSGKVILRILHEFEGDWYPWSLTQNGKDPARYIAAYRHVVDRFRNIGANNVKWMWCLNAEPKPYMVYNYVVNCYPGDTYVDIVATDIYNHPDIGTPDWKSFRYTMTESYYYLVKHYSHKEIYVCEVGCRERDGSEPAGSQTKGEWICSMSRDLQTYFNQAKALVFFSMVKEHDWRINSSTEAQNAFVNCLWNDAYYYGPVGLEEMDNPLSFTAYPNPFKDDFEVRMGPMAASEKELRLRLCDLNGKVVFEWRGDILPRNISISAGIPSGMYILEMRRGDYVARQKLIKSGN